MLWYDLFIYQRGKYSRMHQELKRKLRRTNKPALSRGLEILSHELPQAWFLIPLLPILNPLLNLSFRMVPILSMNCTPLVPTANELPTSLLLLSPTLPFLPLFIHVRHWGLIGASFKFTIFGSDPNLFFGPNACLGFTSSDAVLNHRLTQKLKLWLYRSTAQDLLLWYYVKSLLSN